MAWKEPIPPARKSEWTLLKLDGQAHKHDSLHAFMLRMCAGNFGCLFIIQRMKICVGILLYPLICAGLKIMLLSMYSQ